MRPSSVRVELLTRVNCHLCIEARNIVAQVCAESSVDWVEVDIDKDPTGELLGRFSDYVPVVLVDGVQQAFWRVDPARLRASLAARPLS